MLIATKYNWRDAIFLFETDGTQSVPTTSTVPPADPPSQEDDDEAYDKPRALATIRNLREQAKDAKRLQRELDELKQAEEKRKEAELTAVQLADKRATEAQAAKEALEQRYRTTTIKNAVRMAATKEGFVDPEDAVQLADLSAVEVDENDEVTGAQDAVKALAKLKPHLIATRKPGAPDINGTTGSPPPPQTTKDIAMSHLQKAYAPRSK